MSRFWEKCCKYIHLWFKFSLKMLFYKYLGKLSEISPCGIFLLWFSGLNIYLSVLSFLQRGCSEKFQALQNLFLVRKFQVGLPLFKLIRKYSFTVIFNIILWYFAGQPSMTVLALSPLPENDYVAYKIE